jgi:glyoxylase-like metal-dependent hydrolase (beta-lactamase superfamily II)
MPTCEFRVISIGTLPAHPLWGERDPVRTGHATTTLIVSGDSKILVDPGLPAAALVARLGERARLTPRDITHVFLTSFKPDVRRALAVFDDVPWLIHEREREAVGVPLASRLRHMVEAHPHGHEEVVMLEQDVALLKRCEPAPDELAPHVSLFPLPGVTPGCCGVLIEQPRATILICGDAIPTVEHLEQGKVLPGAADTEQARESFREAIEIADVLVLGRDNAVVNSAKRVF